MRALGLPLTRCLDCGEPKNETLACMSCRERMTALAALDPAKAAAVYQILVEDLNAEPDQHESCADTFARGQAHYQFVAWYRQAISEVLTLGLREDGTIAVVYLGALLPEQEALVSYTNRRLEIYLSGRTWRPRPLSRPSALAERLVLA